MKYWMNIVKPYSILSFLHEFYFVETGKTLILKFQNPDLGESLRKSRSLVEIKYELVFAFFLLRAAKINLAWSNGVPSSNTIL